MHTPPGADGDDAERIGAGNRLGGAVRQRHAGERAETADRDSAWPRLSGGGDGGLVERGDAADAAKCPDPDPDGRTRRRCPRMRSEEHTSELQSLMRISYAVFCL